MDEDFGDAAFLIDRHQVSLTRKEGPTGAMPYNSKINGYDTESENSTRPAGILKQHLTVVQPVDPLGLYTYIFSIHNE